MHPPSTFERDHKIPVRISDFSGTDDRIPAWLFIALVETGYMRITGEGVADKDCIALLAVEFPVGLIRKRKGRRVSPLSSMSGEGIAIILCGYIADLSL